MELSLLILRVVVGLLFIGHGTQKLFGWFGGYGLSGTGGFMETLGLKPGKLNAFLAGTAEAGGGLLLLLGLLTPLGAAAITAAMATAIWTVHRDKGPWNSNQGWELNVLFIAAAVTLAGVGPGEWSLDHALGLDLAGTGWAITALGAGLLGAALNLIQSRVLGRRSVTKDTQATPA
jgi:putative oxidoreductase